MDSHDSAPPPFQPHHPIMMGQAQSQAQAQAQAQALQHHHGSNNNNSNTAMYSLPAPNSAAPAQMHHHHQNQPRFPFNPMNPNPNPLDHHQYSDGSPSGSGGGWFNIEPAKKKRGRPRKYSPDNSIGLGLSPAPVNKAVGSGGGGGGGTPSSEGSAAKRNRGRPPGSVKKQLDALGVPGVGFTPHVITVNSGEDIASKIMAFSQQGPRTVCILSANGAISNVTLRQPAMSGGTVTYEGRFEIISLSGSFQLADENGSRNRTGGLCVSLAGSDGRVLGGGVAGMLKAVSPVQVVVGSFIAEGKKTKSAPSPVSPPPSNMLNFGGGQPAQANAPSPGNSSDSAEESDDGGSPNDRGSGPTYPNAGLQQQQQQNVQAMYSNMGWPNSMKMLPN